MHKTTQVIMAGIARNDAHRGFDKFAPLGRIARVAGIAVLTALAGCAAGSVSNVAFSPATSPTPPEILVDVHEAPNASHASDAAKISAKLQSDLLHRLTDAGFAAEPYAPGAGSHGAAVLRVAITDAEPGDYWEQLLVGFGYGRAKLHLTAGLASADAPQSMMATFDESSSAGRIMPGLVLPVGVSIATKNIVPLAVGGTLKVATSFHGNLGKTAEAASKTIVGQLKNYYKAVGWSWPTAKGA